MIFPRMVSTSASVESMGLLQSQIVPNPISQMMTPCARFRCNEALLIIRTVFDMPPVPNVHQLSDLGVAANVEWDTGMATGRFCGLDQLYRYLHARQNNGTRDVLMDVKNITKVKCYSGVFIRAIVTVKRHGQCVPSRCVCNIIINSASELAAVTIEWTGDTKHVQGILSI
jgi:hypothetical protein